MGEICEHKTATVMEYHGNVTLSECDWGCGAVLISVTKDGITRQMTADEFYTAQTELTALRQRAAELKAILKKSRHCLLGIRDDIYLDDYGDYLSSWDNGVGHLELLLNELGQYDFSDAAMANEGANDG